MELQSQIEIECSDQKSKEDPPKYTVYHFDGDIKFRVELFKWDSAL